MANDHVGYTGNVLIKVKNKKNKVTDQIRVKNAGLSGLFRGIVIALNGNLNKDYLPNYIAVGSSNIATDDLKRNNLENEITRSLITDRNRIDEHFDSDHKLDGWSITFGATIPFSNIANTTIKELGLCGNDNAGSLLARIVLTDDQKIEVKEGTSLTIEWTILVQNK